MEYQEFQENAADKIEDIKQHDPLAIIRFGSSTSEKDYIPEISDLDMIVLSNSQIPGAWTTHPESFKRGLVRGDPFMLAAFFSGNVEYDPHGFVEKLKQLEGIETLKPTYDTVRYVAESINKQLSSAATRYFNPNEQWGSISQVIKNAYNASQGIARAVILTESNTLAGNYTDIVARLNLLDSEEMTRDALSLVRNARHLAEYHQQVDDRREDNPIRIRSESIGDLIDGAEKLYLGFPNHSPFVCQYRTNDVIEHEEKFNPQKLPIDRILYVKRDTSEGEVQIGAMRDDKYFVFGRSMYMDFHQTLEIEDDALVYDMENGRELAHILR